MRKSLSKLLLTAWVMLCPIVSFYTNISAVPPHTTAETEEELKNLLGLTNLDDTILTVLFQHIQGRYFDVSIRYVPIKRIPMLSYIQEKWDSILPIIHHYKTMCMRAEGGYLPVPLCSTRLYEWRIVPAFDVHQVEEYFITSYGKVPTHKTLLLLSQIATEQIKDIPLLKRESKRSKFKLETWFHINWADIKPNLEAWLDQLKKENKLEWLEPINLDDIEQQRAQINPQ